VPILNALGVQSAASGFVPFCQMSGSAATADPAIEQMVGFIGAGIYEETLFRLLLYSALMWLFHWLDFPAIMSFLLAAMGSALLFSAAHHLGPHGEQFETYAFVFRTLAGVYFAVLFQMRGFGIAVGTHAGYDLLVGIVAA
jgi:membrane protease YdiL (CAAX protease family)